jgi:lysophospholipase L1-like esterase
MATQQTLNPTITNPVLIYVYDTFTGSTGVSPHDGNWAGASNYQTTYPGSLVQIESNKFTSSIDTTGLPFNYNPYSGPNNSVSYKNLTSAIQRPFGDYIQLSWGQSIDLFNEIVSPGVAQVTVYVNLKAPDGKTIAVQFNSYDSRPEQQNNAPFVGDGSGNRTAFYAGTPVGNTAYCISDNAKATISDGYVNYSLKFTKEHLSRIISDLIGIGGLASTYTWRAPADWLIDEVGIIHQTYQSLDPNSQAQLQSNVTFTAPSVVKTTEAYPTTITWRDGYPSYTTMVPGLQSAGATAERVNLYDIQSTEASGHNIGAGIQTVTFNWYTDSGFRLNPVAHFAVILRSDENYFRGNRLSDSTGQIRGLRGTGFLIGNLSGYVNEVTGHVGNPLYPSTIVETWYHGVLKDNDLLPDTWGNVKLQDGVTYHVEVNAIIDNSGKSFVSYKISSGGTVLIDIPPVADNNVYYDPTQTGVIMGHVFPGADGYTPTPGWQISVSEFSVSWSALPTNSNDARLSHLTISSGTLNPSFTSDTTYYTSSVQNSVSSITITPTHNVTPVTITVNGVSVTSGSASSPVSLNVGSNTITVIVRAQDGVTTKTYTISVYRAAASLRNLIPGLGSVKSDYTNRPNAGTLTDPVIVGPDLYPNSTWYQPMHTLVTGQGLVYPNANYYDSTNGSSEFWTLIVNNEPNLNNDSVNTGIADRSQPVNGTNFKFSQTNSQIVMRTTQTWGDGSDYQSNPSGSGMIPYLGINTLGSHVFSGNYSDGLIVEYKLQANFVQPGHGLQIYQFIIYFTNGSGTKKAAACYLAPPASESFLGFTAPWNLEWDWRFQGSVYYPGAYFRFYFPSYYNPRRGAGVTAIPIISTNGTTYNLKFDLDDIIKVLFPEDASSTSAIIGIELSMEQTWTGIGTGETLYTEAVIKNVESYPKAVSGVAALGDSTTWGYSNLVNPVVNNMCKAAQDTLASTYGKNITIYNLGRNGSAVKDLLGQSAGTFPNTNGYLQNVLTSPSTVKLVLLNYGVNEAFRNNASYTSDYTVNQFKTDLTTVVNQLKTAGKTVIIQTPNKLRQIGVTTDYWGASRNWVATVTDYATAAREVATSTGVYLDDKWANTVWNSDSAWPAQDAVHPTEATYIVLGQEMALAINTALSPAATYAITSDVLTVNEGQRVTWSITTTNVPNGTVLYWTNTGTTTAPDFSDLVVGPSYYENEGAFVISNNTGTFYKTLVNDQLTEGSETIRIQVRTASTSGPIVATSPIVTVNDTSIGTNSSDATLYSLTISSGTLSPSFNSNTTSYADSVSYGTSSVTVTPTLNESHATITVNGTAVLSGSASGLISLNVGTNTITVVVTAQNSSTKTYTITVTRAPSGASSDATLSALTISNGTLNPSFSSGTTSYTDSVVSGTSSVTVTPTANESHATITVNGNPVTSGSASSTINLNPGTNTITVVVTAQDGNTTKTYTVVVTRAQPPASNDATLSALTASSGTLSPTFSSGTLDYTDSVANTINLLTVTPTVNESHATVTVNGTAVLSGSASGLISLNVGTNVITIIVTAQDGTHTKTYTITVTRAPANSSNDANLSSLTISNGTLSPSFSSGTISYTDSVNYTISSVTVTPTSNESHATITVNGNPVISGAASSSISLNEGPNTITVVVTAQNGTTTKTYTTIVTRAFAGPISSDATLSGLSVSGQALNPSFISGTTSYTGSVLYFVNAILVTPTSHESHATITVNGIPTISGSPAAINLNVGSNIITVLVRAQDGVSTKTYTINMIRNASGPSRDATLSDLKISTNSLSPNFSPGTNNYSAYSVINDQITVTPTHNEQHAIITVNGSSVTSGLTSGPIDLNLGSNRVNVEVVAEDGITRNEYSILVFKLMSNATIDLGVIRASNYQVVKASVDNLEPGQEGTITYTFADGQLPEGMRLDPVSGYLYGFVGYQPAYMLHYRFAIIAVKTIRTSGLVVSVVNEYTLAVKGEIDSSIEWVTNSNLGTIDTDITSELSVVARHLNSTYTIKYNLTDGSLPLGLTLERDGSIAGRVAHNSTGTYTFTVSASDVYELSAIDRTFTLVVQQPDIKKYTAIYFKPLFVKQKREDYRKFISDEFTFDPKLLYRYFDPEFGVQHTIKMILEFGIEQLNLTDYTPALSRNFYRKRFYFGDIKKAIAKDATGAVVYEIVYVDPIDSMVNNAGISVSSTVTSTLPNSVDVYPNSVDNMRNRLEALILPDNSVISVNEYFKPRFMRTPQMGDYKPPSYMRVIPLCYALPGQGNKIISRIKLSGFDFKLLNFEVDRLIVQESADSTTAKYLMLEG